MTEEIPKDIQDKNPSGLPRNSDDKHILRTAIANSRLLIMAAAERGHAIEESVLRVIFDTDEAFQEGGLSNPQKIAFWQTYEQLSSLLDPITIDSIRATYNLQPDKEGFIWLFLGKLNISFSQKCIFGYKLLSTLTLVALIILQVYWSIGHSLVRDIKIQSDEIFSLEKQIRSLETEESAKTKSTSTALSIKENIAKTISSSTHKTLHRTTVEIELGGIDSKLEELFSWREANFGQLANWNHLWGAALIIKEQPWERTSYQELPKESQQHIQFLSALYVLNAISQYFLPILYGLLGATFYVLRQLPREIANLTFSVNSQIEYSLRITQGPLAGIMASFLFSTDDTNVHSIVSESALTSATNLEDYAFSHLGPLATAFLAGYSVELVFKAVDKVISMVTSKSPTNKPETKDTSKASKPSSRYSK
ncbi:MAG: hypothetical protein NXI13_02095 [Proteobacteria bacterium]|nr:hypothetical protein [Pseudomonadota bacterium]